jgi:hypothetical protein
MAGGDGSGLRGGQEWEWDVALSFAGAQRDYARRVAMARGVRCFYDADEQVRLWGAHLAEELSAALSHACHYHPYELAPHRGRTHRLARPGRPDRDPAPDSDRSNGDPDMKAPGGASHSSIGPPATAPLKSLCRPQQYRSACHCTTEIFVPNGPRCQPPAYNLGRSEADANG